MWHFIRKYHAGARTIHRWDDRWTANGHHILHYLDIWQDAMKHKPKPIKQDPICPKCKKPLENADFLMMNVHKKCFDCQIPWNKITGFKL